MLASGEGKPTNSQTLVTAHNQSHLAAKIAPRWVAAKMFAQLSRYTIVIDDAFIMIDDVFIIIDGALIQKNGWHN